MPWLNCKCQFNIAQVLDSQQFVHLAVNRSALLFFSYNYILHKLTQFYIKLTFLRRSATYSLLQHVVEAELDKSRVT